MAGWSLTEELTSPDLTSDLAHTQIAQPMIFAIQAACVRALAEVGVRPSMTMGHSVGEVAAAEAAGVLSLKDAVRVIFNRSRFQQSTENTGGMAVIFGERDAAVEIVARIPNLSIAAHNSQHCIAVAGPSEALARLAQLAPEHKIRTRRLELPYPFHTELMQPLKKPLLDSLAGLSPLPRRHSVSVHNHRHRHGWREAGPDYWWRNVRDTVLFQEGVERAIRLGEQVFVEIGPRATLKSHLRDVADYHEAPVFIDCVLDEKSDEIAVPFEVSAMRLLAAGADVESSWAFGPDPGAGVELPAYLGAGSSTASEKRASRPAS